jgi:hypothetical protein
MCLKGKQGQRGLRRSPKVTSLKSKVLEVFKVFEVSKVLRVSKSILNSAFAIRYLIKVTFLTID